MTVALARRARGLLAFRPLQTLSIVTFSHGFVAVASFLQMAAVARILPLATFGRLATSLAIAGVIEASVNARGTETALAAFAELADDDVAARDALTRRLLRIDFLWSLGAYSVLGIGVAIADLVRGTDSGWLLALMFGGFIAFPWGTTKSYLTVFRGARVFAPIEISYAVTNLVAGVALTALIGGFGFVIGMVLASLARSVIGLRQARLQLRSLLATPPVPDGLPVRRLWWYGVTGTVRSALLNFATQMDVLLLSALATPAAVGLYRAAKTISGLTQRATQPIWFVLKRPIIVGSRREGDTRAQRNVVAAAAAFAVIGALLLPIVIVYGSDIARLTFGRQYGAAGEPLLWLMPGAWVMFAITGWSSLFGSISRSRLTVVALYLSQIGLFAATAVAVGVTAKSVAQALALSQLVTSVCFWILFLRRP